ncbi:hypothetical protein [Vibrio scophthalmi]|uniref:Uncharacterized protein n=1 Tax=Vibrio scophthalmi TaxID=45658 RepID=A0A1E3WIT6_9VIBR|nr:hypothetical protein [Vibrio scophthalmi]ODS09637.1 hypothetical protein VSF3289_03301 [Vibrio scophthalmi]
MQVSKSKFQIILEHLFKRVEHRQLVEAVVREQISVYEAEKRYGISKNTGTRYTKKYEEHIEYLKSLGINV